LVERHEQHYNAIFMDHMMPGMDGVEALERIRAIDSEYARNLPVIALTANAIAGNEQMFLSKGFSAFLPKPIDFYMLDEIIRRWVRDKDYEQVNGLHPDTTSEFPKIVIEGDELMGDGQDEYDPEGSFAELEAIGIDVRASLDRFGGSKEEYLEILDSFATTTKALTASLRDKGGTMSLEDFAIVAHGIKGSSRGVGANREGVLAERLEKAAKAGNQDYVDKNTDAFLDQLDELLAHVRHTVDMLSGSQDKQLLDAPDRELLAQLRQAAAEFSIDGVETALEELERYNYRENNELVTWMRGQCDDLALEAIHLRLSDHLGLAIDDEPAPDDS
jgi:CheY-like chemotaxis protein